MKPDDKFKCALNCIGDDEEAAKQLVAALAYKFSWAGTFYTRSDLPDPWRYDAREWSKLQDNPRWTVGVSAEMVRAGKEAIDSLLDGAG